ncbi:MAG: hypothetical protein RXP28_02265 [Nitrososphaeria archaeon]
MKNPIYSASPSGSQQSGPSQTKSRLGLGIVIGLIIGLVIAGMPAAYFYMNNSSLNSKYTTLESNYASLQSQYSSLQSQYSSLQSQYSSLQSNYSSLNSQYSSLQSKYSSLQSQYSSLNSQYSSLQSIVSLSQTKTLVNSQTISQPAGAYYTFTFNNINYAGYITVDVLSSTVYNTTVVIKGTSSNGISYSSGPINVGYSGTVSYPALPGTVQVEIGSIFSGATETVTITYTY